MEDAIYIVFSATPSRMGRLIRFATRHEYNHVSLSFDRDIHRMYSFARYYHSIPLYGGLIEESILRYGPAFGSARVKICRLPLDEPQFAHLRQELEEMWQDREAYIYNTFAAVASPLHRNPAIPKSYTCITFVDDILTRSHVGQENWGRCLTLRQLEAHLTTSCTKAPPSPLPPRGTGGTMPFWPTPPDSTAFTPPPATLAA